VTDLVAAVLRRMRAEADRVADAPPETLVLTHPATWDVRASARSATRPARPDSAPYDWCPGLAIEPGPQRTMATPTPPASGGPADKRRPRGNAHADGAFPRCPGAA
jgi:hypothetical protein